MAADPDDSPSSDWYVDPDDPTQGRYWDGSAWTDQTVAIPDGLTLRTWGASESLGPPDASAATGTLGGRERWMLAGLLVGLVAFCGIVAWRAAEERTAGGGGARTSVEVEGERVVRLRGSLDLDDPRFIGHEEGAPCAGDDAFADLVAGLAVHVDAVDGFRLADAELGAGRLVPSRSDLADGVGSLILSCRFEFVAEVPVVDRYVIAVEGYGSQSWSRSELEDHDWTARLGVTA